MPVWYHTRKKRISMLMIAHILDSYREKIIEEWVRRLGSEVSPIYSSQPLEALRITVSAATDANYSFLIYNDYGPIDDAVENIGWIRFKAGFPLSDIQKAFELYRSVVVPIFLKEAEKPVLTKFFERLNLCLSYTIHRFSDYFQSLSEKQIRDYTQMLEIKVEERTKELAQSEAKYRTLVEEIRDGYFVNRRGKMIYANRAFCEMHGYTLDEVIGRYYTDFVAPESLEEIKKIYERRVDEGEFKEQYVYYRRHKNGSSLPTENKATLTYYQGAVAAIVICRDITERMETERRIREAERLAHIGQLTTSLAHEIRNPLSAVKMSVQMLLKNPVFSGTDRRRLEILAQEMARLDKMVTEMLDFARPMKFEFQPFSIETIINSSLDVMDARIQEKGIAVEKLIPRGVPEVAIDPEKMEQTIINLLINSIEAVPVGGKIVIRVKHTRGRNGSVSVEIGDTGNGIKREDMAFIFDPFFSRKTKGTGLGLANAKKIIEAHGGSIRAVNQKSLGVCMSLSIPCSTRNPAKNGRVSR